MGIIAVYPKITFAEQAVVQPLPALQMNVELRVTSIDSWLKD
jgi:hypothetical protein